MEVKEEISVEVHSEVIEPPSSKVGTLEKQDPSQPPPPPYSEKNDTKSHTLHPNHYEMEPLGFVRNSPTRLTRINIDDVNDAGNLDELDAHHEFFIMPKNTGKSTSNAFIKIANRDGNHVFSCSIERTQRMVCCSKNSEESARKQPDHAYRLMDTQGLELVTGNLNGKVMEARTGLKNTVGMVTKSTCSRKYTIEPTIGLDSWICIPQGGCCMFPCGVKSFQIVNSNNAKQFGSMRRDAATNKFVITMPEEITVGNKGLILLTGLMIYDMFFSETSFGCGGRCGGFYTARCCCCMIIGIIVALIFIALLVFLIVHLVSDDQIQGSSEHLVESSTRPPAEILNKS